MTKIKNTLKNIKERINCALTLAVTTFLFTPIGVHADDYVDLTKTEIGTNGELVIKTNTGAAATSQGGVTAAANGFNNILKIARVAVSGLTGILAVAMAAILAIKAFNLSKNGDNPSERAKAIQGLIWYFIGAVVLGATSMLTGVFYNMLH